MSSLLEDVHYLAGTIGPRGTGTFAEVAAADYVSRRLVEPRAGSRKIFFSLRPKPK